MVNRGKKFEDIVKESFERVPNVSVDRLHDQTNGYFGSSNICDFIVYKYPYQYYIECKSVHGNTLSIHSNPKPDKNGVLHGFYGNISDKQWEGLLEKSKIPGVTAGVLCWWVDKDITMFLPIKFLSKTKEKKFVSIPSDYADKWILDDYEELPIIVSGKKKRVFFDYDMSQFLTEVSNE